MHANKILVLLDRSIPHLGTIIYLLENNNHWLTKNKNIRICWPTKTQLKIRLASMQHHFVAGNTFRHCIPMRPSIQYVCSHHLICMANRIFFFFHYLPIFGQLGTDWNSPIQIYNLNKSNQNIHTIQRTHVFVWTRCVRVRLSSGLSYCVRRVANDAKKNICVFD